eukprot:CAMPEP_0202861172 /NCGR_PEP_ID=MMETSP1391-20130828/2655_1 /ASSEMBLY_ACC=CAM_ASM_000867 /TAXON_ID=1034604 /ORGANISM="Chlamydomonas leiostraca, Strain SAG 11-49" /LENGTH=61 /DNA_ID=CAMNT_0049540509 /DNA_START=267 /DNA_END=452 /DNA_ORIENTATION=-
MVVVTLCNPPLGHTYKNQRDPTRSMHPQRPALQKPSPTNMRYPLTTQHAAHLQLQPLNANA